MSNQGENAKIHEIKHFKLIENDEHIPKKTHYMGIAYILQTQKGGTSFFKSKDLNSKPVRTKHGACIINEENRLVSIGWNTCLLEDSDPKFETSASLNAILNSNSILKNNIIFLTNFPDNKDAQAIKQSGINKLIYLNSCSKCKQDCCKWRINQCDKCFGAISLLSFTNVQITKFSELKHKNIVKNLGATWVFDLKEYYDTNGKNEKLEVPWELFDPNSQNEDIKDFNLWMFIAVWTAACSQDKHTKVGACLLDKNGNLLSTGYNGFPNDRVKEYFGSLWNEKDDKSLENKHTFVCHAELNAIVNSKPKDINGATMFVTLFPCEHCAKLIITSGIKRVIYLSNHKHKKNEFKNSMLLLQEYRKHEKDFLLKKFQLDESNSKVTIKLKED